MYNKQFSIAALMVAGLFATGCSQQSAGGSQVSGGSQSQIEGGSQVAGSSQAGSQQQVEGGSQVAGSQQSQNETVVAPPVKHTPPPAVVTKPKARTSGNCHGHAANSRTKSIRHCHPNPRGQHRYGYGAKKKYYPRRGGGRWTHTHPAVSGCTKSVRHTHKYKNARHSHHYSCKGKKRQARRNDQWGHTHAAIPRCTDSFRHSHKFNAKNHSHKYSCKGGRSSYNSGGKVDVFALQRKLKAKGYYKGPIDGIVGKGTRGALKRFMNR